MNLSRGNVARAGAMSLEAVVHHPRILPAAATCGTTSRGAVDLNSHTQAISPCFRAERPGKELEHGVPQPTCHPPLRARTASHVACSGARVHVGSSSRQSAAAKATPAVLSCGCNRVQHKPTDRAHVLQRLASHMAASEPAAPTKQRLMRCSVVKD